MDREEHNNVTFFIGSEVEHTQAFSLLTLFVVGEQPLEEILKQAAEHNVDHVFLAANQSYSNDINYSDVVKGLFAEDYVVTIDYPVEAHSYLLKNLCKEIWKSRLFIPMISCKIANVASCNNNLIIKIDDPDFRGANGGVWCLDIEELLTSNRFTSWDKYTADEVVQIIKE